VKGNISEKNYARASLYQWQNHVERIYGKRNASKPEEIIWFRVLENASKVAENLRRYRYGEGMQSLSHVFCWLCAFCIRTNRNIEEIVWKKYPYVCPYCRKDRERAVKSCTCPGHRMETEETPTHKKEMMINEEILKNFRKIFNKNKPRSLDGWVRMFDRLYENSNYSASIEHIGFHLTEEVGEVGRVWRRKQEFEKRVQKGLEKGTDIKKARFQFEVDLDYEIADVFSWACALINKIRWIIEAAEDFGKSAIEIKIEHRKPGYLPMPKVTLSRFVFDEYGEGCPNCGEMICFEENCYIIECKFMTEKKICGFYWKGQKSCPYGKAQSSACGTASSV